MSKLTQIANTYIKLINEWWWFMMMKWIQLSQEEGMIVMGHICKNETGSQLACYNLLSQTTTNEVFNDQVK